VLDFLAIRLGTGDFAQSGGWSPAARRLRGRETGPVSLVEACRMPARQMLYLAWLAGKMKHRLAKCPEIDERTAECDGTNPFLTVRDLTREISRRCSCCNVVGLV
jgi:hypothetical protein